MYKNIRRCNATIILDFETTSLNTKKCNIIDRAFYDYEYELVLS